VQNLPEVAPGLHCPRGSHAAQARTLQSPELRFSSAAATGLAAFPATPGRGDGTPPFLNPFQAPYSEERGSCTAPGNYTARVLVCSFCRLGHLSTRVIQRISFKLVKRAVSRQMQRDTSRVRCKSVLSCSCKKAISLNPDGTKNSKTRSKGPQALCTETLQSRIELVLHNMTFEDK